MKIVLIGAGSAQFGLDMLGDIFTSSILAGSEIDLVDINAENLAKVKNIAQTYIDQNNLPFTLHATTDRKEALPGASFVINSIEVGNRFQLWDQDWSIPLNYGVHQVYGENGGAGGLFHALRITPPILDICADIAELCPDAYIFNYSNPMTAITTTVLRKFPQLHFVGLCHEIASLQRYLPYILGVPYDALATRAAGLNHFSVLLEAHYKDSAPAGSTGRAGSTSHTGRDAYPDILARAPAFFEKILGYSDIWEYILATGDIPRTEGATGLPDIGRTESRRPWSDRGVFRVILERFHLMPITSDSHIGEYIQWASSVADTKGILDFYSLYQGSLSMIKPEIKKEQQERAVSIIEGIITDSGYEEEAVNIMNTGLIPELPSCVAVEVPAKVSAKGLQGVTFPDYPKGFGALLRNYCGVYDLTAEAILQKSRDLAIQALLVNPVVTDCTRIPELVDMMIERQKPWLGYLA